MHFVWDDDNNNVTHTIPGQRFGINTKAAKAGSAQDEQRRIRLVLVLVGETTFGQMHYGNWAVYLVERIYLEILPQLLVGVFCQDEFMRADIWR